MGNLKVESEAGNKHSFPGKFLVEVERIELVVLVGQVEDPQLDLGAALIESIAGKGIELPEIISRNIGGITAIGLLRPDSLDL